MPAYFAERFDEWLRETEGVFSLPQVYKELGMQTADDKQHLRVHVGRLCQRGILERHGEKAGVYRKIAKTVSWMKIGAPLKEAFPLKWPFSLQNYVKISEKAVIVVAGAVNSGKTAFLLNFIKDNMHLSPTYYFSSELSEDQLNFRLSKFEGMGFADWNFAATECSSNFHDAIYPDAINVIDYLEVNENAEYFKLGVYIKKIYDRLSTGVAVIALQKPAGRDTGMGGNSTKEKAQLYISLDPERLKIVKAKTWASEINPRGFCWDFKLIGGAKFVTTREMYKNE